MSHASLWQPQPVFIASERFIETNHLRYRRPVEAEFAKCEELNYVKLAMKYSRLLSKEDAAMRYADFAFFSFWGGGLQEKGLLFSYRCDTLVLWKLSIPLSSLR